MFPSAALVLLAPTDPMPFLPQTLFFCAGMVFILVGSFRSLASWRARKTNTLGRPSQRYKMPATLRIESRLYYLGMCVCWGASFPYWWARALFAGLGLATVLILLYGSNLKVADAPPYDTQSTLRLTQT
jgi:hypothetical protein